MNKLQHIGKNLEHLLSEQIRYLYEYELKHQLRSISYQVFDDKLMIIIEGTVTRPEQVLHNNTQQKLAKKVRTIFDQIILPQIKQLIEENLSLNIVDFLSDTTIRTGRTAVIAIFELKEI